MQLRDARVKRAQMICVDAGNLAHRGKLSGPMLQVFRDEVRCALAPHPELVEEFLAELECFAAGGRILRASERGALKL